MSAKVVSLSVHKNTLEQRKRHATSKEFMAEAKKIARDKQISGYVIVAYTKDEETRTSYDSGHMPPRYLPEFVRAKIIVAIDNASDT